MHILWYIQYIANQKHGEAYHSLSPWSYRFDAPLLWRHNGRGSVSNHQPYDCLLNRLFRRRSKNTSKLRVTDLCAGNSPETGEFPAQMASNAENVSIWWRHHALKRYRTPIESQQSWWFLCILPPLQASFNLILFCACLSMTYTHIRYGNDIHNIFHQIHIHAYYIIIAGSRWVHAYCSTWHMYYLSLPNNTLTGSQAINSYWLYQLNKSSCHGTKRIQLCR